MNLAGVYDRLVSNGRRTFARLTARERFLLLGGFIVVTAAWFHLAIQRPHHDLQAALLREADQADQLAARLGMMTSTDVGSARLVDPRPLPVLAVEVSGQFGVSLSRLSEREAVVDLETEPMTFELLVSWLHSLMNEYGVVVETIEITRQLEPGTVSARLTLSMQQSNL